MFKKIYVEITNICNLNCDFCSKDKRKKQEITLDNYKILLDKIRPFTNYIYLHVKGEPLLHSKIELVFKIAYDKGFKINITTNGTLLKKKEAILINSKGIRQINVSLHSNINNEEYLNEVIDTVKNIKNNSDIIFSLRLWNLNNPKTDNTGVISILEKQFNKVIDKKCKNIKLDNNIYLNFESVFEWPSLNNSFYNESGKCYGLRDHIGILVDGTVIPCCLDSGGIINLGNIYNSSLEDILQTKKYKNMLNNFKNNKKCEELCRHCNFIK